MSSIDIHSGKLVEWIVSRFKMDKNWSEKVTIVREKISNALLDMPESEEIKVLLLGSYINYFHCHKIMDVLKGTESNTKNIFGQYSSKRIKDWQEIIKLYDQNNCYLVDCAQILNQFVCFDIPATKKTMEKNNKTINDSIRKEKDYAGTVHEANVNLTNLFLKYSIDVDLSGTIISDVIRSKLRNSVIDLKPMVSEIEGRIGVLRESADLYTRFVRANVEGDEHECLPTLSYLLEKGNTTVYEWKYGKKPTMTEANFCEEPIDVCEDEGTISWDCVGVEEEFSMIDFGIEVDGETNETPANETMTLLEDQQSRELLLDDMHELISFFSSCIDEARLRAGSVLDSIENIEEKWPQLNCETVESMRYEVTAFMDQLTSKSLVHLLLLRTNPNYIESILTRVEHERSLILKYQNMGAMLKDRVTEAARENVMLEQQLETSRQQCIVLKGQIEQSISKAFDNRKVRIVGEIGTI